MCLTMIYSTGGHAKARPYRGAVSAEIMYNKLEINDLLKLSK